FMHSLFEKLRFEPPEAKDIGRLMMLGHGGHRGSESTHFVCFGLGLCPGFLCFIAGLNRVVALVVVSDLWHWQLCFFALYTQADEINRY
ncbi:hypothetical protein M8C21_025147, partial [Ambrosia artemisiifolia]